MSITEASVAEFLEANPLFSQDEHNLNILLTAIADPKNQKFFARPDALQLFVSSNRPVFHWLASDEKPKDNRNAKAKLIDAGVSPSHHRSAREISAERQEAEAKRESDREQFQAVLRRRELLKLLDAATSLVVPIRSGQYAGQTNWAETYPLRKRETAKVLAEIAAFNSKHPDFKIEV